MFISFAAKTLRVFWCWLLVMVAVLAAGCGPSAVLIPKFDPDAIARQAMEDYDKNKDGKLDEAELEYCPALKSALPNIVGPERKYLTEEDIAERLRKFQASGMGMAMIPCRVSREGKGVKDLTVTFIPEKFMGGAIKPGSGITDERGNVYPKMDGMDAAGLQLGYYRIEVSKKDEEGNELLPPKLNKESKYGQEVPHTRPELILILFE